MSTLRAVVISLPKSADRRALVSENLSDWIVPWSFFDGLDGDGPCAVPEDARRQIIRYKRLMTRGEVGCYKSHYAVLADFVASPQSEWLMVIEDDVWIDTKFDYAGLIDRIAHRGIRYLRLFAKSWKHADVLGIIDGRELLRFRTDPVGLQAYLIRRDAAARFLRSVRSIDIAIDHEMGRFWVNGLDNYAVFLFAVAERASISTIGHETEEEIRLRATPPFLPHLAYRIDGYLGKRLANARFVIGRLFGWANPA